MIVRRLRRIVVSIEKVKNNMTQNERKRESTCFTIGKTNNETKHIEKTKGLNIRLALFVRILIMLGTRNHKNISLL